MTTTDYRNLVWALTGHYPTDDGGGEDSILGEITRRLAQNPKMISLWLKSVADTLEDGVGNGSTCSLQKKHFDELFGPDEE